MRRRGPPAASFQAVIRRHGGVPGFRQKQRSGWHTPGVSTALKEGCGDLLPCKDSIREFGLYRWDPAGNKDCRSRKTTTLWMISRYFVAHGPLG